MLNYSGKPDTNTRKAKRLKDPHAHSQEQDEGKPLQDRRQGGHRSRISSVTSEGEFSN